jgi:hypothetical protein
MSPVYRPWLIYGLGIVLLLGEILFIGYGTGWPATADPCLFGGDCYCERVNKEDVLTGAKGFRQPVNTWSNLYALVTAGLVAWVLMSDRKAGASGNVMKSNSPIADGYVFAVLFLGLGSMWFHASMSSAASWMDGFSMYVFAGFLVFYTIDRLLVMRGVSEAKRSLVFWVGWPVNAVIYTNIAATGLPSEVLIGALVGAYIILELIIGWIGKNDFFAGWIGWRDVPAMIYWLCGLGAFLTAMLFRALAGDGGPLCDPDSWFQPHGLIWHTFSGVMATLMYFYWRRENSQPTS